MISAADVMFEIARDGDARSIKVVKQKEGLDDVEFGFRLITTVLGTTELTEEDVAEGITEGDPITSCYVEYCAIDVPEKDRKLSVNQQYIIDIARKSFEDAWFNADNFLDFCMECYEDDTGFANKQDKSNKKLSFKRVIKDPKMFEKHPDNQLQIRIKL
jgi:hypothetical protein